MIESKARELLGISAKSSFHLNASQLQAVEVAVSGIQDYELTSGQLRNKEQELALAFYNVVSDNGAIPVESFDYNTWTMTRKLITKACVAAYELSEDRVRHILGASIKLLTNEGIVVDDVAIPAITKPAKATPDAVRMSAKRKAQAEKFDKLSDSQIESKAEELAQDMTTIAEAGEFAAELQKRQKAQAKATAKAEKEGAAALDKRVKSSVKYVPTELKGYMAWLGEQGKVNEEGTPLNFAATEFINEAINAWKEYLS